MSQSLAKRTIAFTVVVAMMLPSLPSAVAATQPSAGVATMPLASPYIGATLGDTQAAGAHYAERWERLSDLARQAQGQGNATKREFLADPYDIARVTAEVLDVAKDLRAIGADLDDQFRRDEQYLREKRMPDVFFDRLDKARADFVLRRDRLEDGIARLAQAQKLANFDAQKNVLADVARMVGEMPSARSFVPMTREAIAREGKIARVRAPLEHAAQSKVLAQKAAPGPEFLAATDDAQITSKIREQAASLGNNPVAIFNWVRNNIDYLPTYGSMQGSELTRINKRGNAYDTSSLLIAMLRAAGIPARYQYGTVELPIATAQNWLGGNIAPNQVVDLMQKGGIPTKSIATAAGAITSIRFEHIWVEAYVDFAPSRGAVNRAPTTWVPMDGSFKTYDVHVPIKLSQGAPFDANGVLAALDGAAVKGTNGSVTGFDLTSFAASLDNYRASAVSYVNQVVPGAHLRDIEGFAAIVPANRPILLGLPYSVITKLNSYAALPSTLQHILTITYFASESNYAADASDLTFSMPLAKVGLGTIGVDYVPATAADVSVVAQLRKDNAETLSPYLINVLPQLQIEGAPVNAAALAPVAMGTVQYWTANITDPHGIYPPTTTGNRIIAGSHTAFVVNAAGISHDMVQKRLDLIPDGVSYPIRELLQQAGMHFWMIRDDYDQKWASQFSGKVVRLPSVGAFSTPLQVTFAFGVARTGFFNGYQTDIKRNLYAATNPSAAQQVQMFTLIGNTGSLLESSVWEMLLGKTLCTGASAAKIVSAANEQKIPVYVVDSTNVSAITPLLQTTSDVKQEISNAVAAGKRVIVPQTELTLGRWSGAGYVIQDPTDGSGVYQIDGGLSGGMSGGCGSNAMMESATFKKLLAEQLKQFDAQAANDPRVHAALYADAGALFPIAAGLKAQYLWFMAFHLAAMEFQVALATGNGDDGGTDPGASCNSPCPTCGMGGGGLGGGGGGGGGAGSGAGSGPLGAGNPVSLPTGEKVQTETDYSGAGDDRLVFTRTYRAFAKDIGSRMGNKWRHNFERTLVVQQSAPVDSTGAPLTAGYSIVEDTGARLPAPPSLGPTVPTAVLALRGDGSWFQFNLRSGVYKPTADVPEALGRQPDASGGTTGWTYQNWADETEQYDASGKLTSVTTRKGMTTTLSYDAQGRLQQVRNHFGRTLVFGYNAVGDVDTVTDSAGGIWRYGYDGFGNLTSATGPDQKTRQYLYEQDPNTSLLTGIIDENGDRFATYAYDSRNRVKEELHGTSAEHNVFSYPSDKLVTVTDGLGTVRNYQFTQIFQNMRVTKLDVPCMAGCIGGTASEVTYDANGFVSSSKDFNGNLTIYSNDARGLVTARTDASGTPIARTITTTYDPQWRVAKSVTEPTSAGSRVSAFTLDPRGNVKRKDVTAGTETRSWTYDYNAVGQRTLLDGPRTDVVDATNTTYTPSGNVDTVADAAGNVARFGPYDANGRPSMVTDPNGTVTSLAYDARGRLKTSSTAGETTTYDYDGVGNLKKVTVPDGSFVSYVYDAAHRLTSVSDSLGNSVTYTLDNVGNRTKEDTRDPAGTLARTLGRAFDGLSRMQQLLGAANQVTGFTYDAQGNLKTSTDPLSHLTASDYDALNRLVKVTQPLLDGQPAPGTVNYAYDAQDNLKSVTDPRGLVTGYDYTGFNELKTLTSPDTGVTQYTYDPAGNVKTMQDARGQIVNYSYDPVNRLKSMLYSDETITYTYDDVTTSANSKGRLSKVTDGSGSTTYAYDARGRVTVKTQLVGTASLAVRYGYNAAGQLASITTPANNLVEYGYLNNQVVSVKVNATTVLSGAKYFPFGGLASWTWGNGQGYQRGFDTDGRIQSVTLAAVSRAYGFDAASRITSLTDLQGATSVLTTVGYDNLDRLASAKKAGGFDLGYAYDLVGNRTSDAANASTPTPQARSYTYATSSNRLAALTNPAVAYGYDAVGNTIDDGSFTYTYSGRNRLVEVKQATSTMATYRHNALGQRVAKAVGGATTLFAYDEAGHLLGEYDATGSPLQETVWVSDTPVATLRKSGTTMSIHYVWTDHLDTPRAITTSDAAMAVEWKWDSDPFGAAAAQEIALAYNLRLPGQYFDQETGKHYNYFRDYDPSIGRYTESDPIGLVGGLNTYAFVESGPLNGIDPRGLATYICTKPLHALGDYGPRVYNPTWYNPLYHQFACVRDASGVVTCGGQDRSGSGIFPGSPGKPSDDHWPAPGEGQCKLQDSRNCVDECVKRKIKSKNRPKYAIGPHGTDCQEWSDDVVESCRAECKGKQ